MQWVLPRLYLHGGSQDEKPSFATAELTGRIMRVDVEVSLSNLGAWFKAFGLLHLARRLTLVGSSGLKMAVGERRPTTKSPKLPSHQPSSEETRVRITGCKKRSWRRMAGRVLT